MLPCPLHADDDLRALLASGVRRACVIPNGGVLLGPWLRQRGPWSDGHPLLARVTDLYCAGGAFAGDPPAAHAPRLLFCLRLGQWFAELSAHGELLAWGAWLRTNALGLAALRENHDLIGGAAVLAVSAGPHCYIADLCVSPGADANAYRRMIATIERFNRDAKTLSGHFCKRDGRVRFRQRGIRR